MVVDYASGLEYIINTILNSLSKPTIIAITGMPNSGKTRLRLTARDLLSEYKGITCIEGNDLRSHGKGIWWNEVSELDYILIEDIIYTSTMHYSLSVLGKKPDKILYMITRLDDLSDYLEEEKQIFDAIIYNPLAKKKTV